MLGVEAWFSCVLRVPVAFPAASSPDKHAALLGESSIAPANSMGSEPDCLGLNLVCATHQLRDTSQVMSPLYASVSSSVKQGQC